MPYYNNITLAILAGGKATRMGGVNKALIEIEGKTFIQKIFESLSPLFTQTVIISNERFDFRLQNVQIFPDIITNMGPLGGIHSALVNSQTPYTFVVSCDMPFASVDIASQIVEQFLSKGTDILVPTIDSYHEPLFAVYSKHLVSKIEIILVKSAGKPIKDLFSMANTSYIEFANTTENRRCFANINSTADLENLKGKEID